MTTFGGGLNARHARRGARLLLLPPALLNRFMTQVRHGDVSCYPVKPLLASTGRSQVALALQVSFAGTTPASI